jgi:hypothetical protein
LASFSAFLALPLSFFAFPPFGAMFQSTNLLCEKIFLPESVWNLDGCSRTLLLPLAHSHLTRRLPHIA